MHKALLLALAAVAAATPVALDLPLLSSLDVPTTELPQVSELLSEVEDLTHLELLVDLELPEVQYSSLIRRSSYTWSYPSRSSLQRSERSSPRLRTSSKAMTPSHRLASSLEKVEALIAYLLGLSALDDLSSV